MINLTETGVFSFESVGIIRSPSVGGIVSVMYLPQYSTDSFHFYTSYQPASENAC